MLFCLRKKLFAMRVVEVQAVQTSCGCPIGGSVQAQAGGDFEP